MELIDLFTEQAAPLLLEIREAVGRSDGQLLARAAHKLKGSLSALSTSRPGNAHTNWKKWGAVAT